MAAAEAPAQRRNDQVVVGPRRSPAVLLGGGLPVHTGYCISGSMTVKMDSGEQFTVRPGDAFHMPPGHDAWTEGKEACVLIDVTGVKNYAKPA